MKILQLLERKLFSFMSSRFAMFPFQRFFFVTKKKLHNLVYLAGKRKRIMMIIFFVTNPTVI